MKRSLLLIITVCLAFGACKKDNTGQQKPVSFTKSQQDVLKASNYFGIQLFKNMSAFVDEDQNLFISPLSISFALTMTYNGAASQTALDMQHTLAYSGLSKTGINQSCKDLMQIILNIDPKVSMEIANSIWYRNTFPVKDTFINLNRTYFDAEVKPSDFSSPQTVNLINNWVSDKTHGKINSVIDQISSDDVMYLINGIYFKGNWKFRFETDNTFKSSFKLTSGNTIQTDFMSQKNKFRYMKNDLFSAVELPYGNGGFSMVVMLPNEDKTYTDVISNLTSDNWNLWNSQMDSAKVSLSLPKFKFKYEKNLNKDLTDLGMGIAFVPGQADFSGISDAGQLSISFVLHKSYVDVNEEGTEAAAITVVGIITTAMPGDSDYKYFNVNKPFVFVIKENTTNSMLFMGLVKKPVVE